MTVLILCLISALINIPLHAISGFMGSEFKKLESYNENSSTVPYTY